MKVEAGAWIAFAALMVTILTVSGGGLWALFSRLETNKQLLATQLVDAQRDGKTEADAIWSKVNSNDRDLRLLLDSFAARNAEPIHALREKIGNVELYIRDEYVSKREYEKDHTQLLLALRNLQDAIEKRLDAYEIRVEKALTQQISGKMPLA